MNLFSSEASAAQSVFRDLVESDDADEDVFPLVRLGEF